MSFLARFFGKYKQQPPKALGLSPPSAKRDKAAATPAGVKADTFSKLQALEERKRCGCIRPGVAAGLPGSFISALLQDNREADPRARPTDRCGQ